MTGQFIINYDPEDVEIDEQYDKRDCWLVVDTNTGKVLSVREDKHWADYNYIKHILQPYLSQGLDVTLVEIATRQEKKLMRKALENNSLESTFIDSEYVRGKRNIYAEIKKDTPDIITHDMELHLVHKHSPTEIKDIVLANVPIKKSKKII